MLVTRDKFNHVLDHLKAQPELSLDTETTGVYPFHGDRLFSIIIADLEKEYYFNFNLGDLPKRMLREFNTLFEAPKRMYFFVNAKFDLAMLANEGLFIKGKIVDAGVLARLEYNLHPERYFSMDYLAQYYLDLRKDDRVKKYIAAHYLYKIDAMGDKQPDYTAVPLQTMVEYGCSDARTTFSLCRKILKHIHDNEKVDSKNRPRYAIGDIFSLVKQETDLTATLFKMQLRGVKVDTQYARQSFETCNKKYDEMRVAVKAELGEKFNPNSPKQLGEYVASKGYDLPRTPTGSLQATKQTLSEVDIPIVQTILSGKKQLKKANTYFKNIIDLTDELGYIHCNLNQDVPITGRLSSSKPNLQNLNSRDEEPKVRGCFTPSPGNELLFFDYSKQEMHIMVDVAGETKVLDRMREGEDFYIATAEAIEAETGMKIPRAKAKAIALGLSYGRGIKALASELGVAIGVAKDLRFAFFSGLPKLQLLNENLKASVRLTGKVYNVYGRVLHVPPDKEYKGLNAFVQSTAADNMKRALIMVERALAEFSAKLVLSVHDELIVDCPKGESFNVKSIVSEAMIAAYPHRHLPLAVDVESSDQRWSMKHD